MSNVTNSKNICNADYTTSELTFIITLDHIFCALGILGNLFIFIFFFKHKTASILTNTLIQEQAIVDLMVCLIGIINSYVDIFTITSDSSFWC